MKIYTYKEHEVSQYPKFTERPWQPVGDNVQEVANPDEADFIICPVALHRIKSRNPKRRLFPQSQVPVEQLPHWQKHESKHVFFDCSDFEVDLKGTSAILIRCNLRHWMKPDGRCIPWFWPVDNLSQCADVPENGFQHDISFHAWLSTDIRRKSFASCQAVFGNKIDHKTYPNFFGHIPKDHPERIQRRKNFLISVQNSRVLLCPQSIQGVFPYRFYEAVSAGRIAALFCTGYNLPFQDEIDWDKFTIRFDAEQAPHAGKLIKEFLNKTPDKTLVEMGKYGRDMWLKWLNRDRQPELVAYTLQKVLDGKINFSA